MTVDKKVPKYEGTEQWLHEYITYRTRFLNDLITIENVKIKRFENDEGPMMVKWVDEGKRNLSKLGVRVDEIRLLLARIENKENLSNGSEDNE